MIHERHVDRKLLDQNGGIRVLVTPVRLPPEVLYDTRERTSHTEVFGNNQYLHWRGVLEQDADQRTSLSDVPRSSENCDLPTRMARVKAISKNLRTTFGKNLALLREKAGLTQEAFAEKLDIHLTHLQKLEYGHVTPSFGTLVHIRRALDCTWDELLEAVR